MPAWTASDGENWADELHCKLWIHERERFENVSLDQAQGKVITMTEVNPVCGHVTIYVKSPKDVGLTPCN
mgnify:CR=1 FL=1